MLRLASFTDFEFIYGLYFHPEINPYLLYEPLSKSDFLPIFENLVSEKQLFVFEPDGNPCGMVKIVPLKHRNSHIAYIGGVAVNPEHQGTGLGRKLMREVVAYTKNLGFKRLELSTATFNEAAIRVYESVGFVKEGVMRNYTLLASENRYVDEALFALLIDNQHSN